MTQAGCWDRLTALKDTVGKAHLRDLIGDDPERTDRMLVEGAGVTLDFSRQRVDGQVLDALLGLVDERGVLERRDAMFAGRAVHRAGAWLRCSVAARGVRRFHLRKP